MSTKTAKTVKAKTAAKTTKTAAKTLEEQLKHAQEQLLLIEDDNEVTTQRELIAGLERAFKHEQEELAEQAAIRSMYTSDSMDTLDLEGLHNGDLPLNELIVLLQTKSIRMGNTTLAAIDLTQDHKIKARDANKYKHPLSLVTLLAQAVTKKQFGKIDNKASMTKMMDKMEIQREELNYGDDMPALSYRRNSPFAATVRTIVKKKLQDGLPISNITKFLSSLGKKNSNSQSTKTVIDYVVSEIVESKLIPNLDTMTVEDDGYDMTLPNGSKLLFPPSFFYVPAPSGASGASSNAGLVDSDADSF